MSERIAHFDQMKGIGIILVIMGHVMQFSFGISHSSVVNALGIFHMPLFFVVSGYFTYKMNLEYRIHDVLIRLLSRSIMLLIPLIVWTSIFVLLKKLDFILFCKSNFGVYWFLWILWLLFVIFLVLDYISQKHQFKLIGDIFLFGIPYLSIIYIEIYSNFDGTVNPISYLTTYYRYFAMGFFMKKYAFLSKLFLNNVTYAIGFIAFFVQWYFCDIHNLFLIFLGGTGAVLVLWIFLQYHNKDTYWSKVLATVGRRTLPIYCIHYLLIPNISNYIHRFLDMSNAFFLQFVCSLIVSILILIACLGIDKFIVYNRFLQLLLFGEVRKKAVVS